MNDDNTAQRQNQFENVTGASRSEPLQGAGPKTAKLRQRLIAMSRSPEKVLLGLCALVVAVVAFWFALGAARPRQLLSGQSFTTLSMSGGRPGYSHSIWRETFGKDGNTSSVSESGNVSYASKWSLKGDQLCFDNNQGSASWGAGFEETPPSHVCATLKADGTTPVYSVGNEGYHIVTFFVAGDTLDPGNAEKYRAALLGKTLHLIDAEDNRFKVYFKDPQHVTATLDYADSRKGTEWTPPGKGQRPIFIPYKPYSGDGAWWVIDNRLCLKASSLGGCWYIELEDMPKLTNIVGEKAGQPAFAKISLE